jgi:hypothetical protein
LARISVSAAEYVLEPATRTFVDPPVAEEAAEVMVTAVPALSVTVKV